MSNQEIPLKIQGLTRLDQLELKAELEKQGVSSSDFQSESQKIDRDKHGELATVSAAIVIVSLAAIKAITVWLSKRRQTTTIVFSAKRTKPDGIQEELNLQIKSDRSDEIGSSVIKELGSFFEVDISPLLQEQQ
jgi:hypothetical protein